MVMRALTLAASVLVCAIGVCQGYGLQPMFSPVWRGLLDGPCQYRGYSFLEDEAAIRQMAANGANIGTSGHIWIPTEDPAAPDGNGTDAEGWQQGGPVVEQELRAVASFSAVRVCLAGYGAPLKSVRITLLGPPQPDGNRRSVASAVLRDAPRRSLRGHSRQIRASTFCVSPMLRGLPPSGAHGWTPLANWQCLFPGVLSTTPRFPFSFVLRVETGPPLPRNRRAALHFCSGSVFRMCSRRPA